MLLFSTRIVEEQHIPLKHTMRLFVLPPSLHEKNS